MTHLLNIQYILTSLRYISGSVDTSCGNSYEIRRDVYILLPIPLFLIYAVCTQLLFIFTLFWRAAVRDKMLRLSQPLAVLVLACLLQAATCVTVEVIYLGGQWTYFYISIIRNSYVTFSSILVLNIFMTNE